MLKLLAFIYSKVAGLRNGLYDRGVLETHDLGVRVISVGNLSAGGTGKTPIVAYISELLAERGEKVCVLTRGYGRENADRRVLVSDGERILQDASVTGDEPLELARRLKEQAIIVADADRVSAGEWAVRKFGVTAIVLDDGFQHRKVKRDVDIVCIDATKPPADDKMLPAGRQREPSSGLLRATAIVITRADLVDARRIASLRSEISKWTSNIPIFEARTRLVTKPKIKGSIFAFCGLGNPENFFECLRREGITIAGTRSFPDHHRYSSDDAILLDKEARAAGASALFTTAKDGVKLGEVSFETPLTVIEMNVEIDDAASFAAML